MEGANKLGKFLSEVSNWRWDEFVRAERDPSYSANDALVFALIRACAMRKMSAIKLSLDRIDGKLKTPVRVEFPKIFYLYPNAEAPALDAPEEPELIEAGEEVQIAEVEEKEQIDLMTLSLRQTLSLMSEQPRQLPEAIVAYQRQVEQAVHEQGPMPDENNVPMVKSVVAAHLLIMAQDRNIDALYEVFDQIDGKLVETIQVLGDDIFITSYLAEAPPGATRNKDGVLMLEATESQKLWAHKLSRDGAQK